MSTEFDLCSVDRTKKLPAPKPPEAGRRRASFKDDGTTLKPTIFGTHSHGPDRIRSHSPPSQYQGANRDARSSKRHASPSFWRSAVWRGAGGALPRTATCRHRRFGNRTRRRPRGAIPRRRSHSRPGNDPPTWPWTNSVNYSPYAGREGDRCRAASSASACSAGRGNVAR